MHLHKTECTFTKKIKTNKIQTITNNKMLNHSKKRISKEYIYTFFFLFCYLREKWRTLCNKRSDINLQSTVAGK